MPKSPNQKMKLLVLMQTLLQRSDENHPMTVADLISALSAYDITAERKSIYDDLEVLRQFGLDIVQVKGKSTGYYVASREFELPELKLLVDSVQSSKFITEKKTYSLIKKIEGLASAYDAQLLQRQVYVRGRVKSMNESVYYNVDEISNAINADRVIRFQYFEYTMEKERRFRRDGAIYEVSPFALMWDDENYYLLAWDDMAQMLKHYRVDKMTGISVTDMPRQGKDAFRKIDMSSYSGHVFGMFTGAEQMVKLKFASHLVGAVIDRFGKDIMIIPRGQDYFTVNVPVAVSPQFFGWVFGFGGGVEILYPDSVREEMKQTLRNVAALYAAEEPED